jgi:hypothetical protein
MLNVNMMCPQNNRCSGVGIGILPLLPPSESSTRSTSAAGSPASQSKHSTHSNLGRHLSARNQHFVGLLDDDLASVSSNTPPPSSPSEHSPNSMATTLPMIATDEEGQLIFDFSAPGDLDDALDLVHIRRHESSDSKHMNDHRVLPSSLAMNLTTRLAKKSQEQEQLMAAPFPVPPCKQPQTNNAAFTLTPSFFALPPQPSVSNSPENSEPSSPFPFAPPVPTTTGLGVGLPSLAMSRSPRSSDNNSRTTPTPSNFNSPTPSLDGHRRSISPTSNPPSPLTTPHASPTFTIPTHMHTHARPKEPHPHAPGPLAALHLQHLQNQPFSPQLSGVPSPSLAPPSPLSLYPPEHSSTTINCVMSSAPANPGGFFSQKRGHAKQRSNGGTPVIRPTSPIVKPLKS